MYVEYTTKKHLLGAYIPLNAPFFDPYKINFAT